MMADTGGNGGYIRLHRQILKWEWWSNPNTFRMFIYLLLKANYCDMPFEGKVIHRGQLVTSLPKLAQDTALSVRQVRVSLDHLKLTGEVTDTYTSKYRIITVVNYDKYQTDDRQIDNQMTGILTPSKKNKKDNNINNKPLTRFIAPTLEEVEEYCRVERKNHVSPERFINYYESVGWTVGKGKPMKDWKAAVRTWERSEQTERDYQKDNDMRGLPV